MAWKEINNNIINLIESFLRDFSEEIQGKLYPGNIGELITARDKLIGKLDNALFIKEDSYEELLEDFENLQSDYDDLENAFEDYKCDIRSLVEDLSMIVDKEPNSDKVKQKCLELYNLTRE